MKFKRQNIIYITSLVSIITISLAATADEISQPSLGNPPKAPVALTHSGHCNVIYDVSIKGKPNNISVTFCTDYTIKQASLLSVKGWRYRPKVVNGKAVPQLKVESRVSFRLADADGKNIPEPHSIDEAITVYDDEKSMANIVKQWPKHSGKLKNKENSGFCCVNYSVSQVGFPFNIVTQSCSHEKFEQPAKMVISKWEYEPLTIDSLPVSSGGYLQVIHFAKHRYARIKLPKGYTPIPGNSEDYLQYCNLPL